MKLPRLKSYTDPAPTIGAVFTVGKQGVYEHRFPGVFSTRERAIEAARLDAIKERDTYHTWHIYATFLDCPDVLVGSVGYHKTANDDGTTDRVIGVWPGNRTFKRGGGSEPPSRHLPTPPRHPDDEELDRMFAPLRAEQAARAKARDEHNRLLAEHGFNPDGTWHPASNANTIPTDPPT